MKFQPLVSWWLIVIYALVAIAAAGWPIWKIRHKSRKVLLIWLRRGALLILPALVAIGPSFQGGTSAPGVANLDVIFAIDTTPSMGAQDYAGTSQGSSAVGPFTNDLASAIGHSSTTNAVLGVSTTIAAVTGTGNSGSGPAPTSTGIGCGTSGTAGGSATTTCTASNGAGSSPAGTQPRLNGVKNDLLALAGKLQGAHLEIITFDTSANVILPYTTDVSAFSSALQSMTPDVSNYSQGSAIDEPIDLITQELNSSKTAHPDRNRLLYYLGDGEQTVSAPVKSFASIAPLLNGGGVLGYGTTTGAKMLNYNGSDAANNTLPYVTTIDPNTKQLVPAVSKTDPAALQQIASQLQVTYQDRNQNSPIGSTFDASKAQLAIDHSQHIVHYLNLYWLFAIPLAGLFFWEWQALIVNLFDLRQHRDRGAPHAK